MSGTAYLLPEPEAQFCDANGHPYAGGLIYTYIPGTDTPKDTWQDNAETILNTNPIILDAAGRAIIFGDGDYRFVLRDSTGNLIYDQFTSSGIDNATLTSLQNQINTLTTALNNEITRATGAESTLTTNLNAEISRAEAAEANLQSQITGSTATKWLMGSGTTDATGNYTVTFSTPFTTISTVQATLNQPPINCTIRATGVTTTGCHIFVEDTNNTGGQSGVSVFWLAGGT